MIHMDEGRLQAYADAELTGEDRLTVERHLRDCLSCRSELDDLRLASDGFSAAMLLLERPEPRSREYAVGLPNREGSRWRRMYALPRAAALVLTFTAVASAMIPGTPLYRLIRPGQEEARVAAAPPAPAAAATSAVADEVAPEVLPEAGVSIDPLDGAVRVVLKSAAPELRIRALLSNGPRAGVFGTGGAADARFETAPGRIEVEGADAGELRIELPRAATSATVVVNGREYLRKQGDQLQMVVTTADRTGTEISFHP